MGQIFKSIGKLSNGWTDWHQLWFTSTDSSKNGHRLNPSAPRYLRGHWGGGGVGGHKFKSVGKLSNGCTDWHQIWYTSVDSSGNGHRLNTIRPSISQGELGGRFRGSQIRKYVEAVKRLDRLAPNLAHICRLIWEWINQTNCPWRHKGHLGILWGQTFKSLENLSNGWTDCHQLWFTPADSSGNGHMLNTSRLTVPQGAFWGGVLGGHKVICLGKVSNCSTDWHQIWSADSSGNGHS